MVTDLSFWSKDKDALVADLKFKSFIEAFAFLTKVAILQEKHDHHAEIVNTYNKVKLTLTTHDAGNKITDKDWQLAKEIEGLLDDQN
jgi:4a-hydroxytetrahydrobiopterin dehydratase